MASTATRTGGWAGGLTAATDARVALMAASKRVGLFHCASRAHLEWLRAELTRLHSFKGALFRNSRCPHDLHVLKYATGEARRLLPLLYLEGAPCLHRKATVWTTYRDREGA